MSALLSQRDEEGQKDVVMFLDSNYFFSDEQDEQKAQQRMTNKQRQRWLVMQRWNVPSVAKTERK